jgi:hypothetical protein
MRRKAWAWILCLVFVLLLSLGFTEHGQAANYLLVSIRVVLIGVLSISFVREWWKYRNGRAKPDAGDGVLRRFRRWYYDDAL